MQVPMLDDGEPQRGLSFKAAEEKLAARIALEVQPMRRAS
jgi:hypothetical protein